MILCPDIGGFRIAGDWAKRFRNRKASLSLLVVVLDITDPITMSIITLARNIIAPTANRSYWYSNAYSRHYRWHHWIVAKGSAESQESGALP